MTINGYTKLSYRVEKNIDNKQNLTKIDNNILNIKIFDNFLLCSFWLCSHYHVTCLYKACYFNFSLSELVISDSNVKIREFFKQ